MMHRHQKPRRKGKLSEEHHRDDDASRSGWPAVWTQRIISPQFSIPLMQWHYRPIETSKWWLNTRCMQHRHQEANVKKNRFGIRSIHSAVLLREPADQRAWFATRAWSPQNLSSSFDFADTNGVRAFRSFSNFELNGVAVLNLSFNFGDVNEKVVSALSFNESVSFCLVKPLYCTLCHEPRFSKGYIM